MKRALVFLFVAGTLVLSKDVNAQQGAWIKKSPPSTHVRTIETTPWGLLAGEVDERLYLTPYNGAYFSGDHGQTWEQLGLTERGVTDFAYSNNRIFATTKFVVDSKVGLFFSDDRGDSWEYVPSVGFGTLAVEAYENTVIVGGASRGLWISFDNGLTWEQKIGDGVFGPDISDVYLFEGGFFALGLENVYASYDYGQTWNAIVTLENRNIVSIESTGKRLFAASSSEGLLISNDYGSSWKHLGTWPVQQTGELAYFLGSIYATRIQDSQAYIYKSENNGRTWESTNFSAIGGVLDIGQLFFIPSELFVVTQYDGVYSSQIEEPVETSQFLDRPWTLDENNRMTDYVSAVFDHAYPLLGYNYFNEPPENQTTTVDYLGNRLPIPQTYYSSHNGVDFALPYGTEITAPANGYATYYYCTDCGNSIKIDHQNGYQTTYMHLQGQGLITTTDIPVFVNVGDVIGKVGMTGNTTGPHLHLAVLNDLNEDGNYLNDFPDGLVDPFGWQTKEEFDPWPSFGWADVLGEHYGTPSTYLWHDATNLVQQVFRNQDLVVEIPKRKILIPKLASPFGFTAILAESPIPIVPTGFKYLSDTAFTIKAINLVGKHVLNFEEDVILEIDFSMANLTNIIPESISVYTFDEITGSWEQLPTTVLDLVDKKITAPTGHFSTFAVFGNKVDTAAPVTEISISGEHSAGWYYGYPTLSLYATDSNSINYSLYRLGGDVNWSLFTNPVQLNNSGVFGVEFFSEDSMGNLERIKDQLVRITINSWADTSKVTGGQFIIPPPSTLSSKYKTAL